MLSTSTAATPAITTPAAALFRRSTQSLRPITATAAAAAAHRHTSAAAREWRQRRPGSHGPESFAVLLRGDQHPPQSARNR